MNVRDSEAFAYYDDPARRAAAGQAIRRPDHPLGRHIAVRFTRETIEAVQRLAKPSGMTVSAWIRRAVDAAIRERRRS